MRDVLVGICRNILITKWKSKHEENGYIYVNEIDNYRVASLD